MLSTTEKEADNNLPAEDAISDKCDSPAIITNLGLNIVSTEAIRAPGTELLIERIIIQFIENAYKTRTKIDYCFS